MANLNDIAKSVHDSELKRLNEEKDAETSNLETQDTEETSVDSAKPRKEKKKAPKEDQKTEEVSGLIIDDDDLDEDYEANVSAPASVQGPEEGAVAVKPITKQSIMDMMPRISKLGDREARASAIYDSMQSYRKQIMIENGLTAEEADRAVQKRASREATKSENDWVDAHPHTGVITINAEDADNLQLTDEEHAKLVTTKSIHLVMVEDKEIKNIKTKRLPSGTNKLDFIRKLNTMSNAQVVLPMLGDICTFRGATASEIVSSHLGDADVEDKTELEIISLMMPFIYEHYVDGHYIHKYDENGKIILSYDDFCDQFPFYDGNMALYGIFLASAAPSYDLSLNCPHCRKNFPWKMLPKKMFQPEALDDETRKKVEEIEAHRDDVDWLMNSAAESMKATVWENPDTKNRFAVQAPSITRASTVMTAMRNAGIDNNSQNTADILVGGNAMMLAGMYIYDPETDDYIEFTDSLSDTEDMIKALPSLYESDFNQISKFAQSRFYSPTFNSGKIVCPQCGKDTFYSATPVDLLFRHAQESYQELR